MSTSYRLINSSRYCDERGEHHIYLYFGNGITQVQDVPVNNPVGEPDSQTQL
jgi:hypothetical protein